MELVRGGQQKGQMSSQVKRLLGYRRVIYLLVVPKYLVLP
jgi:hypothetical protein